MGIVEKELANFSLENKGRVKIELNSSKVIHIHIGDLRLDLTKSEFLELANSLDKSVVELERIKNGKS